MSDLEEEDDNSDYDSMFGESDDDNDDNGDNSAASIIANQNSISQEIINAEEDSGVAVAASSSNETAQTAPASVSADVHVKAPLENHPNTNGHLHHEPKSGDVDVPVEQVEYDSMFEDSDDDEENGAIQNAAESITPSPGNDTGTSVNSQQADPQQYKQTQLGSQPQIAPSDDEDFDDMFGDDSSDDEVKVQSIDIQKTIIPRRKRKMGQDPATTSSSSSSSTKASRKVSKIHAGVRALQPIRRRPNEYHQFDMDDFWRALRSWDFVTELNQNMKRGDDADTAATFETLKLDTSTQQPLPDEFHCLEEYIARWAPLQIKETKAQILSEMSSNRTMSYQKVTVPVQVTPQKIGGSDSYSECLVLEIASRSSSGSGNAAMDPSAGRASRRPGDPSGQTEFLQNDLVLITCDSSIVEQAYKGILRPPDKSTYSMSSLLSLHSPFVEGRLAIVGTVKQRCKSLDALKVQVQRRLWKPTSKCSSELFLLRLGSNITGEFLNRYISRIEPFFQKLLLFTRYNCTCSCRPFYSFVNQKLYVSLKRCAV